MVTRRRFVQAIGSSALVSSAGTAFAAAPYPARPVRMIVPLAPGGGSDAIARLVSANLTERFGQQF
ncbi:MAG: hypothetical protein ACK5WE_16020, partial [bacterium]